MSRLGDAFARAREEDRAVLVGYLPAGFPTVAGAIDALCAMVDGGVDVVEVGVPYSDPVMDGPAIQVAVEAALRTGTTMSDVLDTVEAVAATGVPTLVMSYWNLIEQYGVEPFARDLAARGGCGVITPDLTPEEGGDWARATDAHGIDRVYLVALSSTPERIATVTAATSGFVYAASVMGVTGVRSQVSDGASALVARTRAATSLPVAVGLGVSDADQAAAVAAYADGVIVGSAFVRCLLDAETPAAGAAAAGRLAAELAAGVRR
ncbi:MAG: tryptophan synthase subunit alpha [Candidatus Nanopelagicales bacterium]